MLFISNMKSIFSPKLTTLPSQFFKSPQTLIFSNSPKFLQNKPNLLHLRRPNSSSVKSTMETVRMASGEIHVIVGPMFAGKTTALLSRIQSERDRGRSVAVIKSDKDTRYGLDSIVTHDGVKLPCWPLPDLLSFKHKFGIEAYRKLDVIGIDEAQFFEDLYDFCCEAADQDGKTIIIAGLDGDYLRRRFGSVLDIIPLADSVTKLTARCELCGKRASFTFRKTDETKAELIGGADKYMPVCRQHYVNGQAAVEATRIVLESRKVHCESPYLEATSVSS
ncbi:hypothetical protein GIB67_013387 [Kingdonia uniflora]|uniref:Thymidine kinase n=1 Tax=Kingdonia uniflora TaxID=39325 RepID=A0A7J7LQV8_9MAGN|nr:hypothetical protein GIB67_013387 [Kingdonia uniflora]